MPANPAAPARVPLDTSPEAHALQIEAYRRMGGAGRIAIAFRLNDLARQTALAGIRQRHPDYTDDQAVQALRRLQLGDDLTRAVWPHLPLVDP